MNQETAKPDTPASVSDFPPLARRSWAEPWKVKVVDRSK
jgi:hypothetical protein